MSSNIYICLPHASAQYHDFIPYIERSLTHMFKKCLRGKLLMIFSIAFLLIVCIRLHFHLLLFIAMEWTLCVLMVLLPSYRNKWTHFIISLPSSATMYDIITKQLLCSIGTAEANYDTCELSNFIEELSFISRACNFLWKFTIKIIEMLSALPSSTSLTFFYCKII